MSYDLYRAGSPDDEHSRTLLMGTHPTAHAAVVARCNDELEFELARGRQIELTHLIVGPGRDGDRTVHTLICSVGQPAGWPVDLVTELADTATWIRRLNRGRTNPAGRRCMTRAHKPVANPNNHETQWDQDPARPREGARASCSGCDRASADARDITRHSWAPNSSAC